jgi:hypothetical protein
MSGTPPLNFSSSGPVATPPATLLSNLLALVASLAPGYTSALPASLVEDMSSTGLGALVTIDQARVDAVNNVSPYGANPYVLAQLGALLGVPQGSAFNGNVDVVFSGTPGYVIPPGFLIGDGTNQYVIQTGGAIANSGQSQSLLAVATNSNVFPIPAGSVTTIVTSVPSPYTLTVTNPVAGVAATGPQTTEAYRSQVIQAMQVGLSGTATYLKTLLALVPGVSSRLISVLQSGTGWEVICGGGDPFQVAAAIYAGISTPGMLAGSQISSARNVTVSIFDAPDAYQIVFVNPPQQTTTVTVTWNTMLPNFTAGAAVNQYIITATQAYINSIVVGAPINLLVLQEQIQLAVAPVLAATNLTRLQFVVTINNVTTPPNPGTYIIPSDVESYFYVSPSGVTSVQG